MFRHLQLSALALGVFAGYVVPLLVSALLMLQISGAAEANDRDLARSLWGAIVVTNLAGSVAGGYAAAALARHQQLLHGLVSALIGVVVVSPFQRGSLVLIACLVLGGIVGAWLKKRQDS